jgi:hypothetical protein
MALPSYACQPPEYGFTVKPVFETLPTPARPVYHETGRIKGTLMSWNMVGPLPGLPEAASGDTEIQLEFLTTDLNMQHGEMLYQSDHPYGFNEQPVHSIKPRRKPYAMSARYTEWKGGAYPLELGVMLDRTGGPVEESKFYMPLVRTVAVACARAILDPQHEGADGAVRLNLCLNYQRSRLMRPREVLAGSIVELYQRLGES